METAAIYSHLVGVSWMAECTGLCQMSVDHIKVMTKVWERTYRQRTTLPLCMDDELDLRVILTHVTLHVLL